MNIGNRIASIARALNKNNFRFRMVKPAVIRLPCMVKQNPQLINRLRLQCNLHHSSYDSNFL
jgi:hypothetical protein